MAFDITYRDYKGAETQILIGKGVESGVVNDYITRVNNDITGYEYGDENFLMDNINFIDDYSGLLKNAFTFGSTSCTGDAGEWQSYSIWWVEFEIAGVRQPLLRYAWQADTVNTLAEVNDGMFRTETAFPSTTQKIQLSLWDADDNYNADLFNSVSAGDVIRVYNYEMIPEPIRPNIEGENCLKIKVGILSGDNHSFCGSDRPLKYRYYSKEKYTNIVASEVEIGVIIKDSDDHAAMKNILDGGYYVNIYKDSTLKWFGKLSTRFYSEAYAQYPYTITLTGSDQLGSFDKYQPIMIDFPIPQEKVSLIYLISKFLMDESMYHANYTGTKITTLYFSSRFTQSTAGTYLLEGLYLDPLNWMKDDTQYESKKTILVDILKAMHAKIIQWNAAWWIMDFEAQWDGADVTWQRYNLLDDGGYERLSNFVQFKDIVRPYVDSPTDIQVNNDAEMRYEPSLRKLDMVLNYNKTDNDIYGFTNILGNFYEGHNGVTLELNENGRLKYWSGNDFMWNYNTGDDNNGWIYVYDFFFGDGIQSIRTDIPQYDYDGFDFGIELQNLSANKTRAATLDMIVKLDMGGSVYYLDNNAGAGSYEWNSNFRSFRLIGNGQHTVQVEMPYESITDDIEMEVSFVHNPALRSVAVRGLKADFVVNKWEIVEYTQVLDKWINPTESDTAFIENEYHWGLYHDRLPNLNNFHRSAIYLSDGTPVQYFGRDGYDQTISLMDWIGNTIVGDNNSYTNKLIASYFSDLTPFSLMRDAEDTLYRFVSGEYHDKICTWRNIYTQFKGIKNIGYLPDRQDYLGLDYDNSDYAIEFSTLYYGDYHRKVYGDEGVIEGKECVELAIDSLI